MAVPASKDELLLAISTNFAKVVLEFRKVPPDLVRQPCMEGHAAGTRMSVADLAAYLLGWNVLVLKWLQHDARGERIAFPDAGFKWNALGLLAQKFYADYHALSWPDLLDRLIESNGRVIAEVEARTDHALYHVPWYGKWTMGRMIQFNTSSPSANARGRLRKRATAMGV